MDGRAVTLRVVVADDMPLARQRLCRILMTAPDVSIAGQAGDGVTAIEVITREQPDAAFLDIQMPEADGFGVLDALRRSEALPRMPAIVFVTAYDEWAVRAFDVHAVDYLLKPITADRVQRALDRVRQRLSGRPRPSADSTSTRYLQRFVVKASGGLVVVPVADVHCILSEGNYVRLCLDGKSWLLREPLSSVAAQLDPAAFVRIHRSSIVALRSVATVAPIVNGDQLVTLVTGTTLTMSRTHRRAFLDALA